MTDPMLDCDSDGILNTADNCPSVANADQDNEDGDAWGDACDKCPPFPSTSDDDMDGDGVGDKCDPNPNSPGDKIELFENFMHGGPQTHGALVPVYYGTQGDWGFTAQQGGLAEVNIMPGNIYDELAWNLPASFPTHLTLMTRTTPFAAASGSSVPNLAGMAVAYQAGAGSNNPRWDCTAGQHVSGSTTVAISLIDTNGAETTDVGMPDNVTSSVLRQTIDGSGLCTCTDTTNVVGAMTSSCKSNYHHVGLASREEDADYFWFMIVSSP